MAAVGSAYPLSEHVDGSESLRISLSGTVGHLTACIDPTAFAVPGNIAQNIFAYGTMGRNILRGPHLFNTDMSLHKNFQIKERMRFTFRAEAFNVWNNPEFSAPSGNIQAATFGNITGTSTGARAIQFGGKLSF